MSGEEGLLWMDDNPKKTLAQKVEQAAARYAEKHGEPANICFVHPSALPPGAAEWVGPIHLVPLHNMLPDHLLIGVADAAALPSREQAA